MAANRKAARDAKAIESWQSPTATLLDSSSDELLKSLPQLNQTVDELKSFLPVQLSRQAVARPSGRAQGTDIEPSLTVGLLPLNQYRRPK